jgi:phage baseplate assembly protein W
MGSLSDFNTPWGGDLSLSATGGLELISGANLTSQRLIRRLMTNPGDYIFEPSYGAGLPSYVGRPIQAKTIAGIAKAQAAMEATVESVTSVTVFAITVNSFGLTIIYIPRSGGGPQILSYTVTPAGVAAR